jgi:ATP-dependent DNA helicase RecQ
MAAPGFSSERCSMARHPTLDDARGVLLRRFGYPDFRGAQAKVIAAALEGRDVLALMPTGAGKSVCFQIPAELAAGTTLVVSPLISLMVDQVARLRGLGVPAGALHGALTPAERRRTLQAFGTGELTLLYVAPERFRSETFLRVLRRVRVARLAVDEAHCIVSWGGSFRPAYRALGAVRASLGCPCTALTATATPEARDAIVAELGLVEPVVVAGGVDRPNLRWEVVRARDRRAKDRALLGLVPRAAKGCVMVYAATRRTTDSLADLLRSRGVDAVAYHAGVSDRERDRIQTRFIAGQARVIVATSAFGMGIDRPDVRRVVHYDVPGTLEDYAQEAGRAGRDGAPARCVLLYAKGDERTQAHLIRLAHPPPRMLRALLAWLRGRPAFGEEGGWPVVRVRAVEALGSVRRIQGAPQLEAALRLLAEAGVARPASEARAWAVCPAGAPSAAALRRDREALARERRGLRRMRRYAVARTCRRARIMAHFGETSVQDVCGNCDVCLGRAARRTHRASGFGRLPPLFAARLRT